MRQSARSCTCPEKKAGSTDHEYDYHLHAQPLERVTHTIDLGVTVSSELTWTKLWNAKCDNISYIYIYMCVCVCVL